MTDKQSFQRFRVNEVARSFPDTAETLLLDTYLTDEEAASARVFRVIARHRRIITQVPTSISMSYREKAHSGWETPRTEPSSLRATCSSSSAALCTLYPPSLRGRSSFLPSIRLDATLRTSSL